MNDFIKKYSNRKFLLPGSFVALFAVIGVIILFISRAATPFASVEPESGITSGVTKTADSKASNGSYVQFGSSSGTAGSILFQAGFETPVTKGAVAPWGTTPQALNFNGQSTCVSHYPGDLYFDNGSSTSPTPGSIFSAGSSATVPPGVGSWSGRLVIPTSPPVASGCVAHPRADVVLLGPTTATSDLGTTKYYGLMFYVPSGETLHNGDVSGDLLWEFHFNAVWGNSLGWALHTSGTSGMNGTADSVDVQVESGSCNDANNPHPGCDYRSQAGTPPCTNPASQGAIACLPAFFAIPPGQVKYGQWNEMIAEIHWAADTTGFMQNWYKVKGASSWTASADITGIPTVQWDRLIGCTPGSTKSGNCGYPNHEAVESYTAAVTQPFSINLDNMVIGTSFNVVANTMP